MEAVATRPSGWKKEPAAGEQTRHNLNRDKCISANDHYCTLALQKNID